MKVYLRSGTLVHEMSHIKYTYKTIQLSDFNSNRSNEYYGDEGVEKFRKDNQEQTYPSV